MVAQPSSPLAFQPSFFGGKKVFITGHTGFKGSWLCLWLHAMGAEVTGYAIEPPTTPNLFDLAGVGQLLARDNRADVRDAECLAEALRQAAPEIVFHLAAQPLVRESYRSPVETYATNVMGTVHLLEAVRNCPTVRAVVNITSDKCYENLEWPWGYRENEPMGGHDPYSSSKGCAELVASAYRRSYFGGSEGQRDRGTEGQRVRGTEGQRDRGTEGQRVRGTEGQRAGGSANPPSLQSSIPPAVATARAGNVIGGGDWAADRLVPDCLRALLAGEEIVIRSPHAIRPWQHVLEPLSGYLLLAQKLYNEGSRYAEAWNFGPLDEDARPVEWIVQKLCGLWGGGAGYRVDDGGHPHEAHYLKLDISKARADLGWQPRWTLEQALTGIVEWAQVYRRNGDLRAMCLKQIDTFVAGKEL